MFVLVFSLLVLHSVMASPIPEEDPIEYGEWVPSRMTHARDFDRWFDWVPSPWGDNNGPKVLTVKQRIKILETRQKVLFDLVRCQSYAQTDCTPFITQAETVFEVPAKEEQNLTPPTKIIPPVTPGATTASAAVPAASTQASASTEAQQSTTAAPQTPSTEVTTAAATTAAVP